MKEIRYYLNRTTGEKTGNRSIAMGWYRAGNAVEVWKNGRMILAMLM